MSEGPLLAVEDLHVAYRGRSGPVAALRGVSFLIGRERVGIVGESGSGKSTIGLSILRLLPVPPTEFAGGRIVFVRLVDKHHKKASAR